MESDSESTCLYKYVNFLKETYRCAYDSDVIIAGPCVRPLFISMVCSRYDEKHVVWKDNLTQEDALGFNLNTLDPSEHDIMEEVQTQMMNQPEETIIRLENPCHFGMVFGGFIKGI